MNAITAKTGRAGPAWTLVLLAPLIAEVLPGATRISSLFVFPIEVAIWGGGALLIRAAVRHWKLGWLNMLLMACALSIAEEFLVQQTSIAPLVIQIVKGEPYARAFGINYLYLLWALFYEAVLVVLVPVMLCELIFRSRREAPWLTRWSAIMVGVIFLIACVPAWFSWTQIARVKIFHAAPYSPPLGYIVGAVLAIGLLIFASIGPARCALLVKSKPLAPVNPWLLGTAGFIVATIWYCLVLLAFRLKPEFPAGIAMAAGLVIVLKTLYLLPRFSAHPAWSDRHRMGLAFGTITGAMGLSTVAFLYGTPPMDLYGKLILDVTATILLIWLAVRLARPRVT
jgi:hypothetical protein